MINNVNASTAADGGATARILRPAGLKKASDIPISNAQKGVSIDISIEALEKARHFVQRHGDAEKIDVLQPDDTTTLKLGHQLMDALNFDDDDITNFFVSLANKYTEMRQALEEEFSGKGLEIKLNALSQAFDASAEIYAMYRSTQAMIALREERNRIIVHNQMMEQGVESPFFEGVKIELNQDEFYRMVETLITGVRDTLYRFAQLTRQFVLENGAINTGQDREALEVFLQNAERSDGSLSFSDLNIITGIL